jgi:hypothetical protein
VSSPLTRVSRSKIGNALVPDRTRSVRRGVKSAASPVRAARGTIFHTPGVCAPRIPPPGKNGPRGGARPRYPSSEGASADRIQPAGNGGTLESEASRPRLFSSSTAAAPCRCIVTRRRSRVSPCVYPCHTAQNREETREPAENCSRRSEARRSE